MKTLRRVAVLGAGTMGARIAAQFANAGFPVDLLDLNDAATLAGMESAVKQKPVAFFTEKARSLITPGNFDDHLGRVGNCEWIVEAVAENLAIKRSLLERVAAVRSPGTIFSTNTSGIPLAHIAEGFHDELRQHFLGTHFFNPPRYLHLVEIIPGPATLPEVLQAASSFCDLHLGKGVVPCKDTPNFIANRIGCFFGATVHKLTVEGDYTIEEVDALTGPLIGLPKSASFRLVDIVGLDVWVHVLRNLHELAPDDPARDRFLVPEFMERMLERGYLGEKRGQGFYKRVGKGAEREIWAIDRKTLEYHPATQVNVLRAPTCAPWSPATIGRPVSSGRFSATCFCTPRKWCLRFPTVSWRSIAPCAGASPSAPGRSRPGTPGRARDGGPDARGRFRPTGQRRAHAGFRSPFVLRVRRSRRPASHALFRSQRGRLPGARTTSGRAGAAGSPARPRSGETERRRVAARPR